jgi:hypothetical protein
MTRNKTDTCRFFSLKVDDIKTCNSGLYTTTQKKSNILEKRLILCLAKQINLTKPLCFYDFREENIN